MVILNTILSQIFEAHLHEWSRTYLVLVVLALPQPLTFPADKLKNATVPLFVGKKYRFERIFCVPLLLQTETKMNKLLVLHNCFFCVRYLHELYVIVLIARPISWRWPPWLRQTCLQIFTWWFWLWRTAKMSGQSSWNLATNQRTPYIVCVERLVVVHKGKPASWR